MAEILSVLVIQEFDNVVVFDNVVEFNNSLKFYAFKHKLINKCDFNCKICIIKKITSNIDVIYRRIHFATVFFLQLSISTMGSCRIRQFPVYNIFDLLRSFQG